MGRARALLNILVVAAVVGAALGAVFLPLMSYSLAMKDEREFWIWVAEWIGADLLLTLFLCRQEVRAVLRRPPVATPPPAA